jgi:cation transport regulator ChaC
VENDQVPGKETDEPKSFSADSSISTIKPESSDEQASEFLWLFEYGLEMDVFHLNGRERLDGSALLYGPAVLKGYHIAFDAVRSHTGQVVATIVPSDGEGAEVWGVLYRIPRRLTKRSTNQMSLLDKVHTQFEPVDVVVYEIYRKREIMAVTYIASASAQRQFRLLSPDRQVVDPFYTKRLLDSARQHKLPDAYFQELLERSAVKKLVQSASVEQNTEPLAVVMGKNRPQMVTQVARNTANVGYQNRGLMVFACYLVLLLLGVLILAVLQGLEVWSGIFTAQFTPLGVPWFVLVYGLLGGCVSSIIMLGRKRGISVPAFVLVTWFARPYLGIVLAALAYLALNSGFFVLGDRVLQYNALCSLAGAVAGLCEGWVFYKRT